MEHPGATAERSYGSFLIWYEDSVPLRDPFLSTFSSPVYRRKIVQAPTLFSAVQVLTPGSIQRNTVVAEQDEIHILLHHSFGCSCSRCTSEEQVSLEVLCNTGRR